MRRSARRSRSTHGDSGQIRLDFAAVEAAAEEGAREHAAMATTTAPVEPVGASIISFAAGRAARAARAAAAAQSSSAAAASPAIEVARSASDWFELGYDLESTSIEQARTAYTRAVEIDDAHADAHLNLGRLLHESGDLAGAERHYRRALEAAPEEATAAFNLGVVLEDLHRELQAITAYERAMACDPDFVDAYHNVVRLLEKRGDKAGALRVLKRLRERSR